MIKYPLGTNGGQFCFSFDDYHPGNFKIALLFEKYGIRSTFFIETREPEARDQIKHLNLAGHEIGAHTIHHPSDLKKLNGVECMSEIQGSKSMIESITGVPCNSFCYPRGRFNEDVIDKVKLAGFKDARTTHVLQTQVDDPYKTPTTIHLFPLRDEYKSRDIEDLFKFYFDHVSKNGGVLSVWGHAKEIIEYDYWILLEEMIRKLTQ